MYQIDHRVSVRPDDSLFRQRVVILREGQAELQSKDPLQFTRFPDLTRRSFRAIFVEHQNGTCELLDAPPAPTDDVGILRLRRPIRFAIRSPALRMTKLEEAI